MAVDTTKGGGIRQSRKRLRSRQGANIPRGSDIPRTGLQAAAKTFYPLDNRVPVRKSAAGQVMEAFSKFSQDLATELHKREKAAGELQARKGEAAALSNRSLPANAPEPMRKAYLGVAGAKAANNLVGEWLKTAEEAKQNNNLIK